jgi:hypothetical protein
MFARSRHVLAVLLFACSIHGANIFTRTMNPDYLPGISASVSFEVIPSATIQSWAVEDLIPSGWIVSNISHAGIFDVGNGKVKWGPFLDSIPRTLSYIVQPPPTTRADGLFQATARFDAESVTSSVSQPLRKSLLIRNAPASYMPQNPIEISLTADAAVHVQLLAIEEELPLGWVPIQISAGGVWDSANRKIKWGPFTQAPLATRTFNYRLLPAPGETRSLSLHAQARFDNTTIGSDLTIARFLTRPENAVIRSLPANYTPNQPLTITIQANPKDTVVVYSLEENIPAGWVISNITGNGVFDAQNRRIKWGPYFDSPSTPRILAYQATPPANAFSSFAFSGLGQFDQQQAPTVGDVEISNLPATVRRSLPARYSPGDTALAARCGSLSTPL